MSVEEVERISRDLRMRSCSAKSSVLDGSSERVYVIKQGRVRLYHVPKTGAILVPAYSHEEMGKMIGATRESVSRTLGDWRRAGIITMQGRRILAQKPAALRAQAGGPTPVPGGH
jgi:CRP-like cAMP-binding protein